MYLAQNIKSDISDVCEDAIIFYNWLPCCKWNNCVQLKRLFTAGWNRRIIRVNINSGLEHFLSEVLSNLSIRLSMWKCYLTI